jgi:hypothetical protein
MKPTIRDSDRPLPVADRDYYTLKRYEAFREAADYVAGAFAAHPAVRRVALLGCLGFDSLGCGWDNPTMIVTLDSKRRLTVPTSVAPASPGEYFDAQFDEEEDAIVFRRLAGKEDWLAVLKECPVSMDDVPPRRRAMPRRRKL